MQYNINLRALAAEAFGYAPLIRYELPEEPEKEGPSTELYGTPLPPDFEGTGLLGLPVFARVEFLAAAGWAQVVLNDPIVEISRDKLIVTTEIQGRDGSVKEFISNGDYAVTIKGVLASDPTDGRYARRYPTREVQALQAVINAKEAIPVTGRLFKLLGIRNLVIKGHSWPALPGFTNLQAYELRCLSDEPIELQTASLPALGFAFSPTT
ncbi:DUF6046 domain-containing protein [Hymenobacter metallicola]|uniref:DUF6046 domain-containing protein n=1 Tax=Hymenobacter metallicola TaxID=2563114 RepID=A0A4Z0Q215_9BACT|nr:DUF6046 domain-containing protein [Hymenobacter metallicola]TGE23556.1 hypothetical protein E5K02_20435 [Hymenobacter metallicola]